MKSLLWILYFAFVLQACATVPAGERHPANDAAPSTSSTPPPVAPRDMLWSVVQDQCLDDSKAKMALSPCVVTDVMRGYVLFRDQKSVTHHLVIPTKPVSGIEDPQILAPGAPNYWVDAWEGAAQIGRVMNKDIPRDFIGLAVNPVFNRSQDQLHIHIDCLVPSVAAELRAHVDEFSNDWNGPHVTLLGRDYRVRVIDQELLEDINPFQLLARDLHPGSQPMAHHTLILVGAHLANGHNGFILLDRSGDPSDPKAVHGEDLEDKTCAVLAQVPPKQ